MAERLLVQEQNIEISGGVFDTLRSLATAAVTEISDTVQPRAEIKTVDALLDNILGGATDTVAPHEFVENFKEKNGE